MDFWTMLCIAIVVLVILVIVIGILVWKWLAPESPGVGTAHPYAQQQQAPVMPSGTHRSYVPPQGIDPGAAPTMPSCPRCGAPGTFDSARHNYYCGKCRQWF